MMRRVAQNLICSLQAGTAAVPCTNVRTLTAWNTFQSEKGAEWRSMTIAEKTPYIEAAAFLRLSRHKAKTVPKKQNTSDLTQAVVFGLKTYPLVKEAAKQVPVPPVTSDASQTLKPTGQQDGKDGVKTGRIPITPELIAKHKRAMEIVLALRDAVKSRKK